MKDRTGNALQFSGYPLKVARAEKPKLKIVKNESPPFRTWPPLLLLMIPKTGMLTGSGIMSECNRL